MRASPEVRPGAPQPGTEVCEDASQLCKAYDIFLH
jgi:hypothetical protein